MKAASWAMLSDELSGLTFVPMMEKAGHYIWFNKAQGKPGRNVENFPGASIDPLPASKTMTQPQQRRETWPNCAFPARGVIRKERWAQAPPKPSRGHRQTGPGPIPSRRVTHREARCTSCILYWR